MNKPESIEHELMLAVSGHNADLVKRFIANGADVNKMLFGTYPIIIACDSWNMEIIQALLEAGADVNAVSQHQKTALFNAVGSTMNAEVVTLLLKYGADITRIPPAGMSNLSNHPIGEQALMKAAVGRNVELARLLLGLGVNVECRGNYTYESALSKVITTGSVTSVKESLQLVELLLERGAEVDVMDYDSRTPLMLATINQHPGYLKFMEALLKHGADINHQMTGGVTALMNTACRDDKKATQLLLEYGADIAIKNKYGDTAIDIARTTGYHAIASMLEQAALDRVVADGITEDTTVVRDKSRRRL